MNLDILPSGFDPNSFRVSNRTTSGNQQNLSYNYDDNGNITTITDSLLINAAGTLGANQAQTACIYGYNAIGDITNKCGTLFTYGDAMHPSAVTHNPLTGRNYIYDQNGNLLTRGNQTITWDIDNRVSQISVSGGGSTLMEYDYTGMRVKKNAPAEIMLYPFQGYEIDPNGGDHQVHKNRHRDLRLEEGDRAHRIDGERNHPRGGGDLSRGRRRRILGGHGRSGMSLDTKASDIHTIPRFLSAVENTVL